MGLALSFDMGHEVSDLGNIRAISFDADNTLWDFNLVMRHALEKAHAELIGRYPEAKKTFDIETMIQIREEVFKGLKGKTTNLEAIRLESFKEMLRRIGRPDEEFAARLNEVYLKHRFEDIRLYEDVLPVLGALRSIYTLGILSNGNSYPEKCGLKGIFKFAVFSQDHGVEKPDPRLFAVALAQAKCMKEQFLHVGDSLADDVAGAKNAGVRSVWLNRGHKKNDSILAPDFEISSLGELPGLLGK
jgi:HAD superfamily hydrolase (TIGR01549 family)